MHAAFSDLPIRYDDASLRAGEVAIVDRISLTIAPGSPTIFIGPNGSGKSTLIRLGMGLIEPSSGRVTWGGRAVSDGRRRAMVFQRPVMLRRSTSENVEYALASRAVARSDYRETITTLLDRVGLARLADRPARRLSGGEQQRLALA